MVVSLPSLISGKRILVLDGETRSALACVRSLGGRGARLAIASNSKHPIAAASKYVQQSFFLQDPGADSRGYAEEVLALCTKWEADLLLPLSDLSLKSLYPLEDELRTKVRFPFPSAAIFEAAANKYALTIRASDLGMLVPKTTEISLGTSLPRSVPEGFVQMSYPAVLKAADLLVEADLSLCKPAPVYVSSAEEAWRVVRGLESKTGVMLLQERIVGKGLGVFALCKGGKSYLVFSHQRLLEKPPSGGVSVLSESLGLHAPPVGAALRLFEDLSWEGVAMAEFKVDSCGRAFLMEVNPRFWGSLQLAVSCGYDYPYWFSALAFADSEEEKQRICLQLESLAPYAEGRRLRWLLGTLDHALIRLKYEGPKAAAGILLRNDLKLFSSARSTVTDVFRISDLGPFAAELRNWLRNVST